MKKKAMTTNVLFMILMIALLLGIVIFGYSRLDTLMGVMDDREYIEIREGITDLMEFCENPINRDSVTTKTFSSSNFNGICIFDQESNLDDQINEISDSINDEVKLQIEDILEQTDDNIILFRVETFDGEELREISIVDSISTYATRSQCWFTEQRDELEVRMTC